MYQSDSPHCLVQYNCLCSSPSPDVPTKELNQSIFLQVTTTIGEKNKTKQTNKTPQVETLGMQVYFQASTTLEIKTVTNKKILSSIPSSLLVHLPWVSFSFCAKVCFSL